MTDPNLSGFEPDPEPRNSPFHLRIIQTEPIPNTKTGHRCVLACGHVVMTFGRLELAGGVALCTECRDAAGHV